ncbi:MAG: KpsF/GutQ family sugar-phosphate isomerase [Bdellovibrionales bacterium]|nr:KpsF/GutQ family sugar-phosphate isomerase [Bdellovibrionales bacterium]
MLESTPPNEAHRQTVPQNTRASLHGRKTELLESLRSVISLEAYALAQLTNQVDESFFEAIRLLAECRGKVILTGVGKSGIIARKIAATMSSTGTTATFLHPSDGMHGDLGVLSEDDVVIALGKSGESEELVKLLPAFKRLGAKIISITSRRDSTLGRESDVTLFAPVEREACPLDLAPTVSTTVALAIGDALAITLMKVKDFRSEDFAKYHPGGKLGKRLLLNVADLMIRRENCLVLNPNGASFEDTILGLGESGLGIVLFSVDANTLYGVVTDGDVRRLVTKHKAEAFNLLMTEVINRKPITIPSHWMAVDALKFMEDHKPPLNVLPIVDDGKLVGVVRLHELLSVS